MEHRLLHVTRGQGFPLHFIQLWIKMLAHPLGPNPLRKQNRIPEATCPNDTSVTGSFSPSALHC